MASPVTVENEVRRAALNGAALLLLGAFGLVLPPIRRSADECGAQFAPGRAAGTMVQGRWMSVKRWWIQMFSGWGQESWGGFYASHY